MTNANAGDAKVPESGVRMSVRFPHTAFVIDEGLTITNEPTPVPADRAEAIMALAAQYNVPLMVAAEEV